MMTTGAERDQAEHQAAMARLGIELPRRNPKKPHYYNWHYRHPGAVAHRSGSYKPAPRGPDDDPDPDPGFSRSRVKP